MRNILFLVFVASANNQYDRFETLGVLFEDATDYTNFKFNVQPEEQKTFKNQSESFEKLIRWLQQSRDKTINELRGYLYNLKLC